MPQSIPPGCVVQVNVRSDNRPEWMSQNRQNGLPDKRYLVLDRQQVQRMKSVLGQQAERMLMVVCLDEDTGQIEMVADDGQWEVL